MRRKARHFTTVENFHRNPRRTSAPELRTALSLHIAVKLRRRRRRRREAVNDGDYEVHYDDEVRERLGARRARGRELWGGDRRRRSSSSSSRRAGDSLDNERLFQLAEEPRVWSRERSSRQCLEIRGRRRWRFACRRRDSTFFPLSLSFALWLLLFITFLFAYYGGLDRVYDPRTPCASSSFCVRQCCGMLVMCYTLCWIRCNLSCV